MLPRRSVYALIKRTHKLSRDSQLCNREVNFTFFRLKGSNSQHDCATQCRCNVVRSFSSDGEDNSKPPNPFEELIIPPRNAFEAIFSAFKGTKNLLQSQANRDKFVARANDQIIQPAALGIPTSIVLHHDLDNQLFEKYGFDEAEFIKGSKHALQAYYTVYSMIQNDMLRRESGGEEKNNTSLESSGNNTMKPPNETVANDGIDQEKVDARSPGSAENDKLKSKIDIDQRSDTSGLEQAVSDENSLESSKSENVPTSQPSWDAVADSDDQSLTYMLRKMVSPVQFKRLETEAKLMYSLSNLGEKAVFIDDSEVTNAILTSARAMELPPDDFETFKSFEAGDDIEGSKNEKAINTQGNVPTAAQIKVLHSVSLDCSIQPRNDESSKENKQIMTQLNVATFEGWLCGKSVHDELRWRISAIKPFMGI